MSNIPSPVSGDDVPERLPLAFPGPLPGRLFGIDAGGSASMHFGRDATAVKALRRDFHAAVAAACFR